MLNILESLTSNLDKWDIFNGNPTYGFPLYVYNKPNMLTFLKSDFCQELIHSTWGQTTNFIIYNKSCYDIILNYDFVEPFDVFISQKCKQIIPKSYLSTQIPSYSDIENKTVNYSQFISYCNNYMIENLK